MNDATGDDRTLRRIIALLVALAGLAERAAYRAFPIRWLVLCLLRHAEAVVRDHVAETTGWDWSDLEVAFGIDAASFDTDHGSGNGPADALALAWRLRALATVLSALLPAVSGFGGGDGHIVRPVADADAALGRLASRLAQLFATVRGLSRPAPDTS